MKNMVISVVSATLLMIAADGLAFKFSPQTPKAPVIPSMEVEGTVESNISMGFGSSGGSMSQKEFLVTNHVGTPGYLHYYYPHTDAKSASGKLCGCKFTLTSFKEGDAVSTKITGSQETCSGTYTEVTCSVVSNPVVKEGQEARLTVKFNKQ